MTTLITSAAFVNPEMVAEFGQLPPSFLPLGTQRLYELQAQALAHERDRYLSLPETFKPGAADRRLLERNGIRVIPVPEGLSLGASVAYCLEVMDTSGSLSLLHGDTLVSGQSSQPGDRMAVGPLRDGYEWAEVSVDATDSIVGLKRPAANSETPETSILEGFFTFSEARDLREALRECPGDFIAALDLYCRRHVVKAERNLSWHDFGHLQTYFKAKRDFASARAFNNLTIQDRVVTKRSERNAKIEHEALWFEATPSHLKPYTARLLSSGLQGGEYAYATEYEFLPTLAELHVFGTLNASSWTSIMQACESFLEKCAAVRDPRDRRDVLSILGRQKTFERLEEYARLSGVDLSRRFSLNGKDSPSLMQIAEEMAACVEADDLAVPCMMHGDFCFSNIMFNARTGSIRVLDPRGSVDGKAPSLYGDIRYDIAKFLHSAVGRYDLIVAGRVSFEKDPMDPYALSLAFPDDGEAVDIEQLTLAMSVAGVDFSRPSVLAAMIMLFLSMPPLHYENPARAEAFVANALRLYNDHFGDPA